MEQQSRHCASAERCALTPSACSLLCRVNKREVAARWLVGSQPWLIGNLAHCCATASPAAAHLPQPSDPNRSPPSSHLPTSLPACRNARATATQVRKPPRR